jgi:hypothetical protein
MQVKQVQTKACILKYRKPLLEIMMILISKSTCDKIYITLIWVLALSLLPRRFRGPVGPWKTPKKYTSAQNPISGQYLVITTLNRCGGKPGACCVSRVIGIEAANTVVTDQMTTD